MHFLYLGMILDIKVLSKYVCQLALSITKVITHKSFAHSLCSEISLIEQDTIEYVSVVYTAAACIYGKNFFLDFMLIFEKFRLFYDVGTHF